MLAGTSSGGGSDATTDLGQPDVRWKDGYFSGNMHVGHSIFHDGDTNTRVIFDTDTIYLQAGGNNSLIATSGKVEVSGTLDIEEVIEKVTIDTTTSGTLTFDTQAQAVVYLTANQTANRTINFSNANSNMATGESMTFAVLATQGGTAYYLNAYQVDGSSVTPKWSGGAAPTAGNASGIDAYSFTIIKTADATFTVLASVTQYA